FLVLQANLPQKLRTICQNSYQKSQRIFPN
ncbi:uncharacterized protein METZ01_LOCUS308160, partial [marine metagenome]